MTNKEFFTQISQNSSFSAEIREFAQSKLNQLNQYETTRKQKISQKQLAQFDQNSQLILSFITDYPKTAKEIANESKLSIQLTTAILIQLLNKGIIQSEKKQFVSSKTINTYWID